jgi:DNA-binding PadR family transcriptional regulator
MDNRTLTEAQIKLYAKVWPLAGNVSQAIYTATRSVISPAIEAADLAQPGLFYLLLTAQTFEPDPISAEIICRRYPYAAPQIWDQRMVALVDRQLLARDGDHTYRLTEAGRAILSRIAEMFYNQLGQIEQSLRTSIPAARINTLFGYLGRIVKAALSAPIDTSSLRHIHSAAPSVDAPTLAHIDQALDDLNAFRDDAHLAAWRPHNISGHAWELFTFLWRGEVKNANEMAEKAAQRGHSLEAYQAGLNDLLQRGWIEPAGENTYRVTETGKQVRQAAEDATDRYFFTPWLVLNEAETNELHDLLTRLEISLKQLTEAVTT